MAWSRRARRETAANGRDQQAGYPEPPGSEEAGQHR